MPAILNVTHGGLSKDVGQMAYDTSDEDIVRIAEESLELQPGTLQYFVVDRFDTPEGGQRIYLRPKVPFGALSGELEEAKDKAALDIKVVEKSHRRLFTNEPGQPWTDEGNQIATKIHHFVEDLIQDHQGIDLRDLMSVLYSTVDNPILTAIVRERLS
jgi:hypothetical protein